MDGKRAADWMGEQCAEQKTALDEDLERLRALAADSGVEGADDPDLPGPAGWTPPEIDAARSPTELAARPVSGQEEADGDEAEEGDRRADESVDPSQEEDLLGVVLDNRYRIDRLVGVGGMGRVYEAEHVQIGKTVAVKVLHPVYSDEPEVVERFRREARAATAIGHPNIVDVTDSGVTPDGRAFFVMEYLDGVELADVIIEQKWIDPHRAVNIAVQVCQALGGAHKAGIIHRDMKPENVFLTLKEGRPDFVKILDFGIAKSAKLESSRGGGLTQPGLAMGTPEYMSPEQAAGKPADPRVDVYATGGILYAMLVGRPPHQGANIMEILTKKATEPPVPLREYRPEIPEDLEEVVLSALASRPDERPQTMEELEYQLRKFLSGRGAAVAALLGLKRADDDLDGNEYYRADSPTASAMAAIVETTDAEMEFADNGPTPVEGESEPVDVDLGAAGEAAPASAGTAPRPESQELPPLPKEKRAPPPKPKTLPPPDMGYLKSVTMPVVKRQEKSRSWVWLVVLLVVVGGVGGTAVLLKYRTGGKEKRPKAAATMDGGVADGGTVASAGPDAAVAADASSKVATAPPRPRLTKAQIRGLVKQAWKAAKKKRWTSPKKKSVLHYLGELEEAAPKHPQIAKLRKLARKALMRKAALQYRRKAWKRVEKTYRDLLALDPKDFKTKSRLVGVLVRRARQHLSRGINKKAMVLAEEAVLLDGTAWSARYIFAQTLEKAGKRKAAAAEYNRVLKLGAPRRIKASARKGLSRVRRKSK
jgi:serine/threonine protein kinase